MSARSPRKLGPAAFSVAFFVDRTLLSQLDSPQDKKPVDSPTTTGEEETMFADDESKRWDEVVFQPR